MPPPSDRTNAADRDALVGQPLIRVVGPQGQAIFRPRCEHAIGFGHPAGHEIVDHDAEIAFGPIEDDGPASARHGSGIEPGHQTLCGGLFVAGGAVDLPGQEQTIEALGFEVRLELARVHVIVFDGVAGPNDANLFQARNGGHKGKLDVLGQRGRECRSDRRSDRPILQAPEKSDARPARRNGRSCPRSRGNSGGRGSKSARNTSGIGVRCRG